MSGQKDESRFINFGAGPGALPLEALKKIQTDMLNFNEEGISILEMSHRSATYFNVHSETINLIRELMNVPDNYKILLMHGGGRGIFAAIGLNLLHQEFGVADYMISGTWSQIAADDAADYGKINYVFKMARSDNIPDSSMWNLSENASYVYYCDNETIEGIEFPCIPDTKGVPLVCDMSSNIFTRKVDVSKFGIIFACAQKNFGPAGLSIVIIREDLLGERKPRCPAILDFSAVAKSNSLINTPPMFSIYASGIVLNHFKQLGGVDYIENMSSMKSEILYNLIDDSDGFYFNEVHVECRSRTNVPFRIRGGEKVEKKFLELAQKAKMLQLKGHRFVGGIRASIYASVTVEEVTKLAGLMRIFADEYSFRNL